MDSKLSPRSNKGKDSNLSSSSSSSDTHIYDTEHICILCKIQGENHYCGNFISFIYRGKLVYVHENCAELSPRTSTHGIRSEVARGLALVSIIDICIFIDDN